MSVRKRVSIVISLTFLVLLGLLYFTTRWFLLQDAIVAEDKSTTRDVTRLLAALDDQIAGMDANVGDWAPWDDTYAFISSGDTAYIDSNLPNGTFTNLGVELMLFINNSGQIVFGKMIDLESEAEIPIPEGLDSELQAGSHLLSHRDTSDKLAGILSLPEEPMIIASQPILTSQDEGPIRGTLIMGRRLDEADITKLSQRTQLSFSVFPYNDNVLPEDVALARDSLVGGKPIFIAPQSETVVSGYTLVNDVYGQPALILRVDAPREAFIQAKTSMRYLGLTLCVIGIVLGLVTMLLLKRMVITRLTNLTSSVMKVGSQGTAFSRVEASGNDEIFVLATSVNSMLDSLESSRAKERESEERYKNLATISPVGIFRTDPNGATTYVNPMWCHISGLSVDEALGDGWLRAVHPEDKESLTKGWQETTRLHKSSSTDYRFVRPDGTVVWVMGQAIPEMNSENQIVGYIGTITDITERKQAEAELKASQEAERIFSERLTILSETTTELSKAESLDALCRRAVELGRERLDFDRLSIFFLSENSASILGTFGVDAEGRITDERADRHPVGIEPNIRSILQNQIPLLRLTDAPLALKGQDVGQGTHVFAGLWDGNTAIGYLTVDNLLRQRPIGDRDCEIIRLYASALGHLCSLLRAEAELQASHDIEMTFAERLAILSETTTDLSNAESLDALCRRAVELGRERLDFDRVAIWFIAEDRTTMLGTFGVDVDGQVTDERMDQHPLTPESHFWPVVQGQIPLLHLADRPLYMYGQVVGQGSHVCAGLWDGQVTIGYMSFDNLLRQRPFSDRDCEIIRLYASAVGHLVSLRRAEEGLHASEERFAKSFQANPIAVCVSAFPDGRMAEVNEAFLRLTGYKREEVIGHSEPELGLWNDPEVRTSIIRELLENGSVRDLEGQLRAKSGQMRDILASAEIVQLGGQPHALIMLPDITERKQAEEALRESEQRLVTLISNLPGFVYRCANDRNWTTIFFSEGCRNITGYAPEDFLQNKKLAYNDIIRQDYRERLWLKWQTCLENKIAFEEEYPIINAQGETRWLWERGRGIFSEDGRLLFLEGFITDITERKQAEKAIHHNLAELEVLAENSASLSRLLSPDEIGQKIIEILARKLAWHHVAIRLYHPETGSVEVLALGRPGLSAADVEEQIAHLNQIISRPNKGLCGWVIKHGKPVRSGQVQRDRRYVQTYPGIQSGIYVPIQVGERTIGSISVESEAENAFTEQDEHLLATLTSQAAIALENARLYQEAVRAAERRTILHRASQEIAAAGLDLEAVYTAIHQAASELMTVDVFTIGLYDLERQDIEAVFLLDGGQRYPNMRIPLGQGFSGLAIQNRKTLRLNDRNKETPVQIIFFGQKRTSRSVLVVPVFSGNAVIGAISVQSYKAGEYDEEDESMLEMLAAPAGIAIENARLFDQTRRRAEELGVLASVSSALRVSITRDEIIPVILDHLINLLNADNAVLSTLDPATGENVIEQARGEWAKNIGLRLKTGEGLIGLMAETYMPYESSEVTPEKNLGFLDSTSRPEAVAGIPLLVQGQFVGSLWVGRQQAKGKERPVPFAPDEIRLLESVADMAANGLHRATLHEQAIRHAAQLVTVNEIGHLLGEILELNQIYTRLTEAIYNLVPDICGLSISLYDQHLQNITCVCGHFEGAFIDPAELPPLPLDPSGEGHQSHVILTGEPLTTNDIDTRPFIHTTHKLADDPKQTAKSGLFVPMIARDTTIGLIQLQSDTKERFGQEETNLLSLVANTAAIAIENARLLSETQKRLRNLSALHAIDTAIGASVDIRVTLNILLEQTATELKVDAAAVLLLNPFTHALEYTASYGFRAHLVNGTRIQLGSGVAGQAALTRQMQSISDQRGTPLSQEKQKSTFDVYEGEEFFTHYAFPLVAKGQVQGVLEVYHRSLFQPDEEWLTFFNMLAGQAAIAIDNAHLFEDLQRSNLDMVLAYDATIQGWSQALELRDKETQGHTQRVTDLTLRVAQAIGIPNAELEHIRRGTLLHDIGKMGIPDSILLKPGKLTEEEWVIMRRHPGYAYEMLSAIAYLRPALDIPHYHHEKWDGSGYPDGLKGEQIPLYARIFAVVDVYDALTSKRPYRPAWTVKKAIKHIRKQSGKHFDPEIVEAFLNLISEEK